nr:alpha-amylase family protein [Kineococcus siccus]
MDYAVELGASGLSLGPVFASTSHGYDSTDQFRVDPRLGTEEDLDDLLAACRRRGLRVVLDGVFNHVGDRHPFYLEALRDGPGSRYADFFRIDFDAPGGPRAADFEGHGSLVALNHASPAVAQYVTSVLTHWLERGVDGWRLDAAYAVDPGFWRAVLPPVRERHPDAWFVGEVIHGDYAGFVEESGVDSVTQYELWKAVWSALSERNFFELDWTLRRHAEFLGRFLPHTFVGNHDVTRIASRVGGPGAVLALVVLMTTGGVPAVYYGDEQGFTGVKEDRLGGDDAVRPAFPPDPAQLSGLGEWLHRSHQQLIGLRRRHPWLVRARTEAVELANTRYVYRARAEDGPEFLTVELDLTAGARAVVSGASGEELFRYEA